MTRPELLTAKRLTPTLDHLLRGPCTQHWWAHAARWWCTFKAAWYGLLLVIIDASTLTVNLTDNETLTANKAGYGDARRRLTSTKCGWCVRPQRSSRSSVFLRVVPLSERTPPCGVLHTAMVLSRRKDAIGQAARNLERFGKQKDEQRGGRTVMHSMWSEKSVSADRSKARGNSTHLNDGRNMDFSLNKTRSNYTVIISESTVCLWVKPENDTVNPLMAIFGPVYKTTVKPVNDTVNPLMATFGPMYKTVQSSTQK